MYKKKHPQNLIIFIWIFCFVVIPLWNINFLFPSIMFLMFGLVGLYFTLFVNCSIQQINRDENFLSIIYKKGIQKQKIKLKNNEIQKLILNFYIKARTSTNRCHNIICMEIIIYLKNGTSIQVQDDYIMNGFILTVGKNVNQIKSVKTLVKLFEGIENFSYNITKTHKVYDKRYEPKAIESFINS